LEGKDKSDYDTKLTKHRKRTAKLEEHRGQVYSLLRGQCTKSLLEKMKRDATWTAVAASLDPLQLYGLIEKTILTQSDDFFPFAVVYELESGLYSFQQNLLTNNEYLDRLNTKIGIADVVGVTRAHPALLEFVAQETHQKDFGDVSQEEQDEVTTDTVERYLTYIFLRQSGKQHAKVRDDLQDSYT
jgi:hypothetical protein